MSAKTRSPSVTERGTEIYDAYSKKVPEKYQKFADKIRPGVVALLKVVDAILPYLPVVWAYLVKLYNVASPVWDEMMLVQGLVLTFFGGSFLTLIAAVEAFQIVGKDKIMNAWRHVEREYKAVSKENELDNKKDDNKDGIADVNQISGEEWVRRKTELVLQTVDPVHFQAAIAGFYAGFMAIIAALRHKFAQTSALGCAIGDVVEDHAGRHLEPVIKSIVPEQYHKWCPLLVQFICRAPCVMFAYWLQRVISTVHSAVRGGNILAKALFNTAKKRSLMSQEPSSKVKLGLAVTLAFLGIAMQLSNGLGLPWFLRIPLLPLSIVEYILSWFVAYGSY